MSGLDRAFIKAYHHDEQDHETPAAHRVAAPVVPPSPSVVPRPHANFFPSAPAAPKEEEASLANEVDHEENQPAAREDSGGWSDGEQFSPYQDDIDPLSTGTTASPKVESPSVFQVKRFAWPDVCERLVDDAADEFDQLISELAPSGQPTGRCVAATSCQRGEGTTSLTLCLALAAVRAGVSTVIIDADLHRSDVASRLGVLPQLGWEDVAAGRIPLSETLIESVEDGVSLLPLNKNDDMATANEPDDGAMWVEPIGEETAQTITRLSPIVDELKAQFELVLIDCGPLSAGALSNDHKSFIDTAVLIDDVRVTNYDEIGAACQQLDLAGIPCSGIVENFAA